MGLLSAQATPASTELKVAASFLAIPPGQYLSKHDPLQLVVGRVSLTVTGDFVVRLPFSLKNPSRVRWPFGV